MSDKERLEEIKSSYLEGQHRLFGTSWVSMPKENSDWLIEQAERVEKLEKEKDEWKYTAQSYYMTNQELREQNKRLREALEFYAGGNHYSDKLYDDKIILLDDGEIARKVLEG